jgi:hypothetical protein
MGEECSTQGRDENANKIIVLKWCDHFENIGGDGRILKRVLREMG